MFEYVDELNENCIPFDSYGKHNFDDYWIDKETLEIYHFIAG